jgi:uncharacterized delta-60 repeat protein
VCMLRRSGLSLAGLSLLMLLLAWGCGDGGCLGESVPAPGSLVWAKRAGGASQDYGRDVAVLTDGSIAVVGWFEGTATFGQGESNETLLTSAGNWDIFVARYYSDGTLAWAKGAGSTGTDEGQGIAVLSDGSVALTGYFTGTATFGQGDANETSLISAEYEDIFVACYNADGTLAWAKRAGGTSLYDEGEALVALSDGSLVVTGAFGGTATFGEGEANETDLTAGATATDLGLFVARYDADGAVVWAKGTRDAKGLGIAALTDDSAAVTGYFGYFSFSSTTTFGQGEPNETDLTALSNGDIFVARYNPDGTLGWVKSAGGTEQDQGFGVAALSDGSLVATGFFCQTATFGDGEPNETTLVSAGSRDIFIARHSADGSLVWAKRAGGGGGTSGDWGFDIAAFLDDSVALTGFFHQTATFGEGEANQTSLTATGPEELFLARYGSDGSLGWAIGAAGDFDEGRGVAVLPGDSVVVTGLFFDSATFGPCEPRETTLASAGQADIFVARYNP